MQAESSNDESEDGECGNQAGLGVPRGPEAHAVEIPEHVPAKEYLVW